MVTTNRQLRPDVDDIASALSRIETDAEYARLLRGKNVVVVGPAGTLIDAAQGASIDSHDLIVRFNTAVEYMPFDEKLARDVGTRTDILYCNPEVVRDRIGKQQGLSSGRFVKACEVAGIKYVVNTNNDFTYAGGDASKCRAEHAEFQKFLDDHAVETKFRTLFSTPDALCKWLRGYIARTGFIGIVDLLRYDLRRLRITGMTFYHRGGHLFLEDSIEELHPLGNHRGEFPNGNILGHNSYLELRLLKMLADSFGQKLKLDEHLRGLLETCED